MARRKGICLKLVLSRHQVTDWGNKKAKDGQCQAKQNESRVGRGLIDSKSIEKPRLINEISQKRKTYKAKDKRTDHSLSRVLVMEVT
jgi:hypothetical protein